MSYTPIKTLEIPTVRNIRESREICHNYGAVLTVGPDRGEVYDFGHPNHKVVTFSDVSLKTHPGAPQMSQILDAVSWGIGKENLLVHCHAGISRSTATAWGVAIGNGVDAEDAICRLLEAHPIESDPFDRSSWESQKRPFSPNKLIVSHLQNIFGYKNNELLTLLNKYERWGY